MGRLSPGAGSNPRFCTSGRGFYRQVDGTATPPPPRSFSYEYRRGLCSTLSTVADDCSQPVSPTSKGSWRTEAPKPRTHRKIHRTCYPRQSGASANMNALPFAVRKVVMSRYALTLCRNSNSLWQVHHLQHLGHLRRTCAQISGSPCKTAPSRLWTLRIVGFDRSA